MAGQPLACQSLSHWYDSQTYTHSVSLWCDSEEKFTRHKGIWIFRFRGGRLNHSANEAAKKKKEEKERKEEEGEKEEEEGEKKKKMMMMTMIKIFLQLVQIYHCEVQPCGISSLVQIQLNLVWSRIFLIIILFFYFFFFFFLV